MTQSNHLAAFGPAESLRTRTIPGQSDHNRTIVIQAVAAAPVTVHNAALGRMTQALPARGLPPASGIGVAVRSANRGGDGGAVSRDADARVEKISSAEVDKSVRFRPPEDFASDVGGENFAVGRKRVVHPGISWKLKHTEARLLRRGEGRNSQANSNEKRGPFVQSVFTL